MPYKLNANEGLIDLKKEIEGEFIRFDDKNDEQEDQEEEEFMGFDN